MATRTELSSLAARYDLVIVGGGITGAGILREAVATGAKVLLVEQSDFASGTSSWSSKLVHGGLRYLKNLQWRLTLESVRERQRLMREAPGLVEPQIFLMPVYAGIKPGKWTLRIGLWLYDFMAGSWRSRWHAAAQLLGIEPSVRSDGLRGAIGYEDARTDDARLVLRLILEAVAAGGTALNYVGAEPQAKDGRVIGVKLSDRVSGATREIEATMVVNATGAWAGGLGDGAPQLRPLRGSHLVLPAHKLPVSHAVSWLHPKDHRPIFAYPWEGAVVYGTTDLDHGDALAEPRMNEVEAQYLMEGLHHQFPSLNLQLSDAVSCYSGVRPIVAGGKADPSAESRESAMWSAPGMVGITGGKLTTFRVTARQVLAEAAKQEPKLAPARNVATFDSVAGFGAQRRIVGRYGRAADALKKGASAQELQPIDGSPYCMAELRWALRHEHVVHLADLLMRRTRIGLVMEQGGAAILPQVLELCRAELGWDAARCAQEEADYRGYWQRQHQVPA